MCGENLAYIWLQVALMPWRAVQVLFGMTA